MKKKANRKSKAGAASAPARAKGARRGPAAKAGAKPAAKPGPPAKAKPKSKFKAKAKAKSKPAKSARSAQAEGPKPKAPSAAQAKAKAASSVRSTRSPKPAKMVSGEGPGGKTAPKPKDRAGARGRGKGGTKGGSAKPKSAGSLLRQVAPRLREDLERDTEVTLAPEHISRTLPESVPAEDEGALRKVMSSLTALFGGRDDLSDAELEALLDSKMASGEIPPSAALDPLDEAQSLVYEAWNSEGPQRGRLARKALETSPDCADAYVILAEEAGDKEQALELYRKGVEAGERALGPDAFRRSEGRFWEVMETRPYMRARLGLAECLRELGRKEEAASHLRELLRLNPSDDQGVRKILDRFQAGTGQEA